MYQILSDRVILRSCGEDSKKFLNSLSTNKIEHSKLIYTYFLNNQGRYLYDCFLYAFDDSNIYLDVSSKIANAFIKYLNSRKLRSKLEITKHDDEYRVLYSKSRADITAGLVFASQDPRHEKMGSRVCVESQVIEKNEVTDVELLQQDKYEYAVIDGCDDMIFEKSIPIEYGAERQQALAFDKGCYLGQEVISRAKYQGVVRKKIFVLQSSKNDGFRDVQQNDPVLNAQGKKVGIVCSVYLDKAIALLRTEKVSEKEMSGDASFEISGMETKIIVSI